MAIRHSYPTKLAQAVVMAIEDGDKDKAVEAIRTLRGALNSGYQAPSPHAVADLLTSLLVMIERAWPD